MTCHSKFHLGILAISVPAIVQQIAFSSKKNEPLFTQEKAALKKSRDDLLYLEYNYSILIIEMNKMILKNQNRVHQQQLYANLKI